MVNLSLLVYILSPVTLSRLLILKVSSRSITSWCQKRVPSRSTLIICLATMTCGADIAWESTEPFPLAYSWLGHLERLTPHDLPFYLVWDMAEETDGIKKEWFSDLGFLQQCSSCWVIMESQVFLGWVAIIPLLVRKSTMNWLVTVANAWHKSIKYVNKGFCCSRLLSWIHKKKWRAC